MDGSSGYNNAPPYRASPGGRDPGNGDFDDLQEYPGPDGAPNPSKSRAAVLGEFGGAELLVLGHIWSSNHTAYGMQSCKNNLKSTLVGFQDNFLPLIRDQGLSAAVYTQLTDVEHEMKGVVTYDRKVKKNGFNCVRSIRNYWRIEHLTCIK